MRPILCTLVAVVSVLAGTGSSRGGSVVLVAGGGTGGEGGRADRAALASPFGVGFDQAGALYFVEMTGQRVRKVGIDGLLSTVAGTGDKGDRGDGGPAARAEFNGPHHLLVESDGGILVADTWNNRVRKIDGASGQIRTVVGTGRKGFSGDGGPATEADFGGIYCLALDEGRRALYLADLDNRRVRVVNRKTGIVTTLAGNGKKGVPDDDADAQSAPLLDPRAVVADGRGNVYVLERAGNALRVIARSGKIRTVPGFAGKWKLNGPKHLCVDPENNVLIADTENHRVVTYHPSDGSITLVAGTGRPGASGVGGPPESVELNQPHGVFLGPDGAVYIADSSNHRVLKIAR